MQPTILHKIDQICYVCALASVFIAVALAIFGIWIENASDAVWRSLATCGVLALGNAAVMVINGSLRYGRNRRGE